MTKTEDFDLGEFLGDSLSLQCNISHPARHMYPPKPEDHQYYEKFAQREPFEIIGEYKFSKPEVKTIIGSPIQEFYRGANIFITGGTGFIGKVLTEKLIRAVPNIGKIYLLIRSKKGKSSQERFQQLLEDKLFSRMRAEVPDYLSKLTVVDGDIGEPGLGLSDSDRQELRDKIHIVFHSAADVRFIEPLRVAITSNVVGSKRVIDLAKEMKNLRSYLHVSTAYSQCVRRVVDEYVPRMSIDYKEILKYIDSKTDEQLKEETPRIMQGWPNTYTFSKAVCEEMVQEEAKDLPVCIFRPSVVTPTYLEPVRGWTDNLYGPTGLLVGAGHGILHCFHMTGELTVDTVPVDFVVNCMIAAAWRTADNKYRNPDSLTVYNFTNTSVHPGLCWKVAVEFALKQKNNWPFNRAIWYTSFFYTENDYIHNFFHILLHKIPGICFDKLAELFGAPAGLSKIYKRIETLKEQTDYFNFTTWEFRNNNVMELWRSLHEEDKKVFNFDVREVDLREHFIVSKLGIKYYYLKEKMEDIPAATRKHNWLFWIHNSLKLGCCVVALKLMVITARALPF